MTDAELTAAAEAYARHAKDCTCKGATLDTDKRDGFLAGAERMREACEGEIDDLKVYKKTIYEYVQCTGNTSPKTLGYHVAEALVMDHKDLQIQLTAANARIEKLRAALEQNQFALQCMIIKWNGAVPGLTEQQVWDGAIAARDATRKLLAAHGGRGEG